MDKKIKEAIEVLKKGGIVIFPTDTAFGIGCRIDDEKAIKRLFEIRKRPLIQATPVLVSSIKMAERYWEFIPQEAMRLIKKYWPGALTIILQSRIDKVPSLVRGGGKNIGVRMPDHKITLEIIRNVGVPILGPSANFHGEKTPYDFEDLNSKLLKLVDYVLPGACLFKKVSTIIDCSQKPWRILREGVTVINNLTLLIDTIDNKKVAVGLQIGNRKYWLIENIKSNQTQVVLPLIDKLLKQKNVDLKDLGEVQINVDDNGSFTGQRIGKSIGNALAFTLGIPVNFKKFNAILKE